MSRLALYAAQLRDEGHHTDKIEHGYLPHYERHLDPREITTLVEIGIHKGASLRLWTRAFPNAQVVGIDTTPVGTYPPVSLGNVIELRSSNAITKGVMQKVCETWGRPDVLVDDGSHNANDVIDALALWWPVVRPGGWYVIEDLGVVWHPQWGGQENGGPSLAWHAVCGMLEAAVRNSGCVEFHAYEQIVFMRKPS